MVMDDKTLSSNPKVKILHYLIKYFNELFK